MRVGIIAEGRGDLAVIENIVKGCLDLDLEHIQRLRPEYSLDQTDLHGQPEEQFSNWEHVQRECRERTRIEDFLDSPLDENHVVIIHIDTDVAEHPGFDVERPPREPHEDYVRELHARVAAKLDQWLGDDMDKAQVSYAIAVEQTDAWVLTLYSSSGKGKQTSTHRDPKKTLLKELNGPKHLRPKERNKLFKLRTFRFYQELSKGLRKPKQLCDCAERSQSLRLFLDALERWRHPPP